ncbi:hypothetical protein [Cellulosilyticum ruminicola]|uniref:hypothetical protein n=1 Tax=Cellulosilyticum ruminicola TaxID=425254 RepID=UPI0006CFDAF5|nr:hypothetical protein [Cellulosilyticum ruminicola]
MKKFKTLLFSLLIGTFAISIIGCSQPSSNLATSTENTTAKNTLANLQKLELPTDVNLKTFTIKNGLYSIDLPETWVQDTENTDLLIVDDASGHLTAMVDYYPISTVSKEMQGNNLDAFIKLYEKKGIPKLLSMADASELITLETDNLLEAKAYELTVNVDENTTNKAYFVYAQTNDFFYSISISGDESTYTENIEALKYIPLTLKEY